MVDFLKALFGVSLIFVLVWYAAIGVEAAHKQKIGQVAGWLSRGFRREDREVKRGGFRLLSKRIDGLQAHVDRRMDSLSGAILSKADRADLKMAASTHDVALLKSRVEGITKGVEDVSRKLDSLTVLVQQHSEVLTKHEATFNTLEVMASGSWQGLDVRRALGEEGV